MARIPKLDALVLVEQRLAGVPLPTVDRNVMSQVDQPRSQLLGERLESAITCRNPTASDYRDFQTVHFSPPPTRRAGMFCDMPRALSGVVPFHWPRFQVPLQGNLP